MKNNDSKINSLFVEAALSVDADFAQLERLGTLIASQTLDTEFNLDQARKLLVNFSQIGEHVGGGIQTLPKELEAARIRAEAAAEKVGARADEIQMRIRESDQIAERFQNLGEMAKKLTVSVGELKRPANSKLTEEEKSYIEKHLPDINQQINILMDEASKLKEDSRKANLKTMEKNAHALSQTLHSVRTKLSAFV